MSKRTAGLFRLIAILSVLALVAAACGGDDGESTTTAAPDTETTSGGGDDGGGDTGELTALTVAVPFPDIVMFNMYAVAEGQGYYEEEGLTVEVITADDVRAAVVSGSVDIGVDSAGSAIEGVRSDIGFQIIAGHHCRQGFSFAVQPEVSDVSDLDGTDIVLAGTAGDPAAFEREKVLALNGWDLSTVETNQVFPGPGSDTWREFFIADQVTLIPFFGDDRPALEEDGAKFIVDDVLAFPNDVHLAETNWVAENPDVVEGFLRATMKAIEFYTAPQVGEIPENHADVMTLWRDAGLDDAADFAEANVDSPWSIDAGNVCPNLYYDEVAWNLTISNQNLEPLDFEGTGVNLEHMLAAQASLGIDNSEPIGITFP